MEMIRQSETIKGKWCRKLNAALDRYKLPLENSNI